VLCNDLAALSFLAAVVAPLTERAERVPEAGAAECQTGTEGAAERHLRREQDGQREQCQKHDRATGAVQILRGEGSDQFADRPAGPERAAADVDAAERHLQQAGQAAKQHDGSDRLRVDRIQRTAPEVVPPERH
jgi:hypothetical protein